MDFIILSTGTDCVVFAPSSVLMVFFYTYIVCGYRVSDTTQWQQGVARRHHLC